eukprot:GEMP01057224.1.p1 GENE.GEMP01057224.1~~GEMP01057224.1.p1  ORF type:complete len:171 (+),score=31.93 GEMP01057224.1:253-765(+)
MPKTKRRRPRMWRTQTLRNEFRRQLDEEARAVREEQRKLHRRDRADFEEAKREIGDHQPVAPPLKVRAAVESKKTQRPTRPEIVFRKKQKVTETPKGTTDAPTIENPTPVQTPFVARINDLPPTARENDPLDGTASCLAPRDDRTAAAPSNIIAGLQYESDSESSGTASG